MRYLITALVFLPALYLDFVLYQIASPWIALGTLLLIALGLYVYLSDRAYTYRYLFPGLVGFALFVIMPLVYTVYISFTKYSSKNLLPFERSLALLRQDTFLTGDSSFKYMLYDQGNNQFIAYLEDERNPGSRFASEPFGLVAGAPTPHDEVSQKLRALRPGEVIPGKPLEVSQITRAQLYMPMRRLQFALPDDSLLGPEGLQRFVSRERTWSLNKDGSLTNKKDNRIIHPDFTKGYFVDSKGEKVGVGFRTFYGFENYARILSDPRIQTPFLRIFIWNVAFAALSVFGCFVVGIFLAVLLNWKELKFRKGYRTLLILPYAVPGILSILIFKGIFSQQYGPVNELIRGLVGWAPEWETNPWGARAMVLIVNIWLGYPYMMLVCTGLLQSIPTVLYEASAIDGGGAIMNFRRITLPLILQPLFPILIASFAFNFNNFALIYLLTAGGPKMMGGGIAGDTDILVSYTFNLAFRDSGTNYGLASAVATIIFFIVAFLAWLNLKIGARKVKF